MSAYAILGNFCRLALIALVALLIAVPAVAKTNNNKAPGLESGVHKIFSPANLTISFLPNQEDTSILADKLGYFNQYGIKALLKENGVPIFRNGNQIGVIDVVTFLTHPRIGADLHVVAKDSRHNLPIVVRKDGGINHISRVVGKKIAVPSKTSLPFLMVAKALKSAGLQVTDVKWEILPSLKMPSSLKEGHVDVICGYTPWIVQPIQEGWGQKLANASEIFGNAFNGMVTHVVVTTKALKKPVETLASDTAWNNVLIRYLASLEKAAMDASSRSKRSNITNILSAHTGANASLQKVVLDKYIKWQTRRLCTAKHLKLWVNEMANLGIVTNNVSIDKLILIKPARYSTMLRRYGVQKW